MLREEVLNSWNNLKAQLTKQKEYLAFYQRSPFLQIASETPREIIAIPITSDLAKIYPFEIVIELGSGKAKVLTDQVRSIDKARLGDKIGQVGETKMTEISEKMKRVMALEKQYE